MSEYCYLLWDELQKAVSSFIGASIVIGCSLAIVTKLLYYFTHVSRPTFLNAKFEWITEMSNHAEALEDSPTDISEKYEIRCNSCSGDRKFIESAGTYILLTKCGHILCNRCCRRLIRLKQKPTCPRCPKVVLYRCDCRRLYLWTERQFSSASLQYLIVLFSKFRLFGNL